MSHESSRLIKKMKNLKFVWSPSGIDEFHGITAANICQPITKTKKIEMGKIEFQHICTEDQHNSIPLIYHKVLEEKEGGPKSEYLIRLSCE